MTNDEIVNLEKKIKLKITRIKVDIEALEELTKPISPDSSLGRITRMDAINTKGVNEAALRHSREKLAKLELALNSVNDADFGICKMCNNPIPFARMMYMPESTRCVNCAEK